MKKLCIWHVKMCSHQFCRAFTPSVLMRRQWDFFSADLEVGAISTFSVTTAIASCVPRQSDASVSM